MARLRSRAKRTLREAMTGKMRIYTATQQEERNDTGVLQTSFRIYYGFVPMKVEILTIAGAKFARRKTLQM
jgi:hypothetical protein